MKVTFFSYCYMQDNLLCRRKRLVALEALQVQPVCTPTKPDSPSKLGWTGSLSSVKQDWAQWLSSSFDFKALQPVAVALQDRASAIGQRVLALNCTHIPGTKSDSLKVSDSSRVVLSPLRNVSRIHIKAKSRSGCDSPTRSNFCRLEERHNTPQSFLFLFFIFTLVFSVLPGVWVRIMKSCFKTDYCVNKKNKQPRILKCTF